jgi:hypothetical protein
MTKLRRKECQSSRWGTGIDLIVMRCSALWGAASALACERDRRLRWLIIMRNSLVFALLLGIMIWPAFYNNQPFFFFDTTAYIRAADLGVQSLTHYTTPWSLSAADKDGGGDESTDDPSDQSINSVKDKTVFFGRSPYYGILLYLGEVTGGFWISIFLQALALLVALAWVLRALELPTWPHLLWIGIVIATATSASFFTSFLMPDVFAALTILGCSVLVGFPRRLSIVDYSIWLFLLAVSLMFHDSHILIAATLLLLGFAWNLLTGRWGNWRGLGFIGFALLLAACAQVVLDFAVQRVVGASPLRLPFLMARVIEDGPGYRFLRDTCPGSGFQVCDYVGRLPMSSSEFLWGSEMKPGVFAQSSPEVKQALSAEQNEFLLAVIEYDPIGQISASLRNIGLQLSALRLSDFEYNDDEKRVFAIKIPVEYRDALRRSAAYRRAVPVGFFSGVILVTFICGGAFSMCILLSPRRRQSLTAEVRSVCAWVIVGILVNAAVCGVLSGPHDRYALRVAWLVPFIALVLALKSRSRSAMRVLVHKT